MSCCLAGTNDETGLGASGQVQELQERSRTIRRVHDHQEHHQDDQEQLQDHFYVGFKWV